MNPAEKKTVTRVWKAINKPIRPRGSYFETTGGAWSVFSKTFGWFQASEELTDEQKTEIERRFRDQAEAVFGTRDGVW